MDKLYKCKQCGRLVPKTNYFSKIINGESVGLCGKHYSQYYKYNKFLDDSPETQYTRNKYEITNEGVWIYCCNRQKEFTGKFIIDESDFEKVIKHKWRFARGNFCTGNTHVIQIHTFLMEPNENQVVDHINGDRTDNRRDNLRITTQAKNCINKKLQGNNKSGMAGVSWDKDRNKWAPEIAMDHKKCHLGRYSKFEDAAYARYIAELVLFEKYRSFRNDDYILKIINQCNKKTEIDTYVVNKLYKRGLLDLD